MNSSLVQDIAIERAPFDAATAVDAAEITELYRHFDGFGSLLYVGISKSALVRSFSIKRHLIGSATLRG